MAFVKKSRFTIDGGRTECESIGHDPSGAPAVCARQRGHIGPHASEWSGYEWDDSVPLVHAECGAPGYRDGWTCQKLSGHTGSHGVRTESGSDWYDWPNTSSPAPVLTSPSRYISTDPSSSTQYAFEDGHAGHHRNVRHRWPKMSSYAEDARSAAMRLRMLVTEDGDWLVDPNSKQFQEDVATLVHLAGLEPIKHSYSDDKARCLAEELKAAMRA